MDLQSAIERAEKWMVQSSALADWLTFDSSVRHRVAASLFHLCAEYQQAIYILATQELIGPALALMRPQLEVYVRGVWYHQCATDTQLSSFIKGKEPPKISVLLAAIESLPGFESHDLREAKQAAWKVLNDFTHGGSIQVRARITPTEIIRNHQPDHVVGMLGWSSTLSFMAYVGLAKISEDDSLATQLLDTLKAIYPDETKPEIVR